MIHTTLITRSGMESNLFSANEVLTVGQVLGEGEGEALDIYPRFSTRPKTIAANILTATGEGDGLSTVGHSRDLMDLEPDVTAAVPTGDIARSLGHVDIDDTSVVHVAVSPDTNGGTSSYSNSGGSSMCLGGVAAEVGAVNIGNLRRGQTFR